MAKKTVGTTTVDVTGLSQLRTALKSAADGTDARLRTGLKSAGSIVQRQAQENASWSTKIPGTIKVSVTAKRIVVYSNSGQAVTWETGGRHPVFGDRNLWVKQEAKPFLQPAAEEKASQVATAILDAVAEISL